MKVTDLKATVIKNNGLPAWESIQGSKERDWHYCHRCKAPFQGRCACDKLGRLADCWPK